MSHYFDHLIAFLDQNFTFCLIPAILILWAVKTLFKTNLNSATALLWITYYIIGYALITWTFTIIHIFISPDEHAIILRSTGTYAATYWMMFLLALIMPFSLFFAKLRKLFWYVLIVAFCMKIGYYFERFVLLTTSIHRDYELPFSDMSLLNQMLQSMAISFLKGLIITFILLLGFQVYKSVRFK